MQASSLENLCKNQDDWKMVKKQKQVVCPLSMWASQVMVKFMLKPRESKYHDAQVEPNCNIKCQELSI